MTQPGSTDSWRPVAELLGHGATRGKHSGLTQTFPSSSEQLSLLEALRSPRVAADKAQMAKGQDIASSLQSVLNQLSVFDSIRRCPILAITGLLNAGKSSLLATWLSPHNRARVLRGQANNAGTHRFVLWLPSIWRSEPEFLNVLVTFLTSVCGHPPEELADDPATASLQYNGRVLSNSLLKPQNSQASASLIVPHSTEFEATNTNELHGVDPLSIPLIAYDDGLNRLKVGLVDCPDIQTGFLDSAPAIIREDERWSSATTERHAARVEGSTGDDLPSLRRSYLQRMGRVCSAFIVVSKLSSLHDETLLKILLTLRDAVPGVPRFLAVNKVKARYAPATVIEESRGLVERFDIRRVYLAYDYRSALASQWIPPAPAAMDSTENDPLPIFFEPQPRAGSASSPAQHPEYLFELGKQLDIGSLARESSRSLLVQLKKNSLRTMDWLKQNQTLRREKLADAWRAVAMACFEVMAERDPQGTTIGLRLQASPTIVAQLADSLQRTAPLWMQPSLRIDRTVRQFHRALADSAARFKILQTASDSVANFAKRFRRGEGARVLTDEKLADSIRSYDRHDALSELGQPLLLAACQTAMSRFAAEDKATLNDQELEVWSRQVWQQMSFKEKLRRGTQPVAVMMAPLLAAILIPIDAGGTAVLVFASTKELLAAAGIATLLTPMATGNEAVGIVHRETPWRQLSDLFAIVCDAVGIPRPRPEQLPLVAVQGEPRQLATSEIERKVNLERTAFYDWHLEPSVLDALQLGLQQLVD